ncbi:MAG TPA: hypothetical protein DCF33_07375 [Saprospirales bacterium]|nr:hypothetical protein [Saprospirales bacterium]
MRYLLFCCFFPSLLAAQGPIDGYMKGKGVLDLAPSFSFNKAKTFEGAGGNKFEEPYKGQMLSIFAEYGVTNNFDLVATAAAVFTPIQSGLQDGGLFAKYRPLYASLGKAGNFGVVLSAGAGFPIGSYEPTATGALGQRAVTVPGRLIVQWDSPIGLFLNVTGGYHFRLDDLKTQDIEQIRQTRPTYEPETPQDFSTLLVKIGFPAKHYYLDGWIEWQHTQGGSDYMPNVPDLAQAYGVSYTQIGGTAYYSDNGRTGFFLSGGYILSGRNTGLIQRITLGMVFKV